MHPHGVALHARLRRRLPRRLHARRRLRRAGRGVHLRLGGDARLGRRLAVPRPRAQPHAQHVPRAVRRGDRQAEGRPDPRRRARALHAQLLAPGDRHPAADPLHQRPHLRRQHADDPRQGRPERRAARDRRRQQLPHLPHPRPPLARLRAGPSSTTRPSGPTRRSPPRSARTTPGVGYTTVMSSRTRTPGWPAGTSWTPEERRPTDAPVPLTAAGRAGRRAGLPAGGAGRRLSARRQPRQGRPKARKGKAKTLKVCKQRKCKLPDDRRGGRRKARGGDTIKVEQRAPTRRASTSPARAMTG